MVPAASNSAHADSPADHMSGHRGRMRAKLLDKGSEALSELELLEMLPCAGNRRGDTKPLAKALMRRFAFQFFVAKNTKNSYLFAIPGIGAKNGERQSSSDTYVRKRHGVWCLAYQIHIRAPSPLLWFIFWRSPCLHHSYLANGMVAAYETLRYSKRRFYRRNEETAL